MDNGLQLGYITTYDPIKATVGIKALGGPAYFDVPFDLALGSYTCPVLPIIDSDTGEIVRVGSMVYFVKFSDTLIKVVSIFNDDAYVVQPIVGTASSAIKTQVTDPLLKMLGAGDTLVAAPGKISTAEGYRRSGAWLLLKSGGQVTLSNETSSAQLSFEADGSASLYSAAYKLHGLTTVLEETSDGNWELTAGEAAILLQPDGVLELSSGASVFGMDLSSISMSAVDLELSAAEAFTLVSTDISAECQTLNLVIKDEMTISLSNGIVITASEDRVDISMPGKKFTVGGSNPVVCTKPGVASIEELDDLLVSTTLSAGVA